jgi:hypothetical protein
MDSTPRSPGAALSPPSAAVATPRDRLLICGCILLVTALAWVYLIHLARHMESPIDADMMAKMGMATNQPWTASVGGANITDYTIWSSLAARCSVPLHPQLTSD